MRLKPYQEEFQKLDQIDEQMIKEFSENPLIKLGDLVSLSYYGFQKIAEAHQVETLQVQVSETPALNLAVAKIHNPLTHWSGFGASSCRNSIENHAFGVAEKKALRNAVRLSLPPSYIRTATLHFLKEPNCPPQIFEKGSKK